MTMLAPIDANHLARVRAEESADRSPIGAGELAGRFTAMLEQLNGVDGSTVGADAAVTDPLPVAGAVSPPRLGLGAVSLFAQIAGEAGATDDGAQSPEPIQDPAQVVQTAIRDGNAADFRWLTTLLTQNEAEAPGLA